MIDNGQRSVQDLSCINGKKKNVKPLDLEEFVERFSLKITQNRRIILYLVDSICN